MPAQCEHPGVFARAIAMKLVRLFTIAYHFMICLGMYWRMRAAFEATFAQAHFFEYRIDRRGMLRLTAMAGEHDAAFLEGEYIAGFRPKGEQGQRLPGFYGGAGECSPVLVAHLGDEVAVTIGDGDVAAMYRFN